jgi:serine/threonine-protein kinase
VSPLPQRFGGYMLLKRLGSGGGGDVHLARNLEREHGPATVVVKRLHENLVERSEFVARFRHEAELAGAVDDPHVAKVYDAGEIDGVLFIALEYIPGWPLSRVLRELSDSDTPPPISAAIDFAQTALRGLGALHSATKDGVKLGIIHRDIAPKNIMVRANGSACLIDLGIGKSRLQDWKTRTGFVMGSPGYMAPEHVTAKAIDHRSDLYAMSIVLWETLTLSTFVPGNTPQVKMMAVARGHYRAPSTVRADIPPALDAVFAKALARDREERYQNAEELLDALHSAVPDRSTSAEWFAEKMPGEELEREETEIRALYTDETPILNPQPAQVTIVEAPPPLPPRRTLMPQLALGALLVAAGLGMVYALERDREHTAVEVVTPAVLEVHAPQVKVVAREVEQAKPIQKPVEQTLPADEPVPKIKTKKAALSPEKPQERPVPKIEVPAKDRIQALKARARKLRSTAAENERAQIEDVITALMLIDESASKERLDELDAKLRSLER